MTTQVTEEQQFTYADLVPFLGQYIAARDRREDADKLLKVIGGPLRDWLEKNRPEHILDGEHDYEAFLQARAGSLELDCMGLASKRPDLLTWAAEHGLLKLNTKVWEALDTSAAEMFQLRDFTSPGAGSEALQVKRRKG